MAPAGLLPFEPNSLCQKCCTVVELHHPWDWRWSRHLWQTWLMAESKGKPTRSTGFLHWCPSHIQTRHVWLLTKEVRIIIGRKPGLQSSFECKRMKANYTLHPYSSCWLLQSGLAYSGLLSSSGERQCQLPESVREHWLVTWVSRLILCPQVVCWTKREENPQE